MLCPPCSPPGSPKRHISCGSNKPTKPRAQSSSSRPVPMALFHSGTQPSPGPQESKPPTKGKGQVLGASIDGQLTIPEVPTDLPWPWAVLRYLPYCPKPSEEGPVLLSSVSPTAPLRTSSCFPSGHLETEIQQQKKNLTSAGKAPVSSSVKPRDNPLQQSHMLERRNLWGEQVREKSRPQGRGVLELRELLPLGITHTPLWLLWGRGIPSHGTVREQVPWSSPSHCQLPWERCGQGMSVTTSAEGLPGPIPCLRGPRAGGWGRAGLGLHRGTFCAGPLRCGCLPAAGHARGSHPQEGAKACTSHGHTGSGTALTPRPGAGLTASLKHILHPVAAEWQSSSAPTATGLRLCCGTTGEHQVSAQGCARACSGSPGRSPGETRSREVCSHQNHIQTTVLTAPSHIFTPCPSTGPIQR